MASRSAANFVVRAPGRLSVARTARGRSPRERGGRETAIAGCRRPATAPASDECRMVSRSVGGARPERSPRQSSRPRTGRRGSATRDERAPADVSRRSARSTRGRVDGVRLRAARGAVRSERQLVRTAPAGRMAPSSRSRGGLEGSAVRTNCWSIAQHGHPAQVAAWAGCGDVHHTWLAAGRSNRSAAFALGQSDPPRSGSGSRIRIRSERNANSASALGSALGRSRWRPRYGRRSSLIRSLLMANAPRAFGGGATHLPAREASKQVSPQVGRLVPAGADGGPCP